MNSFKNLLFTTIVIFILSGNVFAQRGNQFDTRQFCFDYHKYSCNFEERLVNFDYNPQSKSTLFRRGETAETNFIAYKGYDYRLRFCGQDDLLEGQKIAFFIRDGKTRKLIYENSTEGFPQEFEFSCTSSTRILVEISLPPEPENRLKPGNRFEYKGCIGVLIESRRTPVTGFKK
jgi:hypothetical protein